MLPSPPAPASPPAPPPPHPTPPDPSGDAPLKRWICPLTFRARLDRHNVHVPQQQDRFQTLILSLPFIKQTVAGDRLLRERRVCARVGLLEEVAKGLDLLRLDLPPHTRDARA